jgi:hypothetical protein
MNICNLRINNIYERSNIIPISQGSPTNKIENASATEYSLNENVFDPSKSSPPNEFLLKLQLRMNIYNSFIKEEIRKSE